MEAECCGLPDCIHGILPFTNTILFPSLPLLNFSSQTAPHGNSSYFTSHVKLSENSTCDLDPNAKPDGKLPPYLTNLSESSIHYMIAYCIVFVIAFSGNPKVLCSVRKRYSKTKSRISLLMMHLSLADLIVCCTLIPTEIFWRLTIQWRGGNFMCKLMQFFRAFGLYQSSMVLICVSFDRFFAILFPMQMLGTRGHKRIKIMLGIAWIASTTFSVPQAILFSVASHPEYPSFKQCVTNDLLKSTEHVRMYSIFPVSAMYFVPLLVTIFTFTAILIKIIHKGRQNLESIESEEEFQQYQQSSRRSRWSSLSFPMRAHPMRGHTENISFSNSNIQPNPTSSGLQAQGKAHSATVQTDVSSKTGLCFGDGPANEVTTSASITNPCNLTAGFSFNQHNQSTQPEFSEMIKFGRVKSSRTRTALRRSANGVKQMSRAKSRSLLMTVVIVAAFVFCWTPYVVMTLWYTIDWEGARDVDPRIQDALFVMAVANSCVNPLIYGSFTKNCCNVSKVFRRISHTRSQL